MLLFVYKVKWFCLKVKTWNNVYTKDKKSNQPYIQFLNNNSNNNNNIHFKLKSNLLKKNNYHGINRKEIIMSVLI